MVALAIVEIPLHYKGTIMTLTAKKLSEISFKN